MTAKANTGTARPKKQSLESALNLKEPAGIMALLNDTAKPGEPLQGARDLPMDTIEPNPFQSRQVFHVQALEELADSIREHGVIEPIIVRQVGERFEIVAGERRYRASQMAEQASIPVRIMSLDDAKASLITALENLQREDLDIEDEARQFAHVLTLTGMSQRALAKMLGKDHLYVSRRVKLLRRPDLMEEYRSGRMKLLEAVNLVDLEGEDGSLRTSPDGGEEASVASEELSHDPFELVEREDMHGFVVKRGPRQEGGERREAGTHRASTRFRWRPLQQFHTWVGRTNVEDIPVDERASVRAQLTEIKEALEKQITQLERIGDEPQAAPEEN